MEVAHKASPEEAIESLQHFVEDFKQKTGMELMVTINIQHKYVPQNNQRQELIKEVCSTLENIFQDEYTGIRIIGLQKIRMHVLLRMIFVKILLDMDVRAAEIARFLDRDHTAINYYKKQANGFIKTRDKQFMSLYNQSIEALKSSDSQLLKNKVA